jgi:hypothetical protein
MRYLVVLCAAMVLAGIAATSTSAAIDTRSSLCKRVDDLGRSHGECVRLDRPSEVCQSIEVFTTYPYDMQILVADENNVAVPGSDVIQVDRFGDCVGSFAPWQHTWVAIAIFT